MQLRFASAGVTCQSTEGIPPDCGWWRIDISLADPSQLTPGVLDLGSGGIDLFIQESGNPNSPDPNDCPGAVGGGALPATLVIQSVDDDQAVVELQGFDTYLLDGQADGVYTAPRCN